MIVFIYQVCDDHGDDKVGEDEWSDGDGQDEVDSSYHVVRRVLNCTMYLWKDKYHQPSIINLNGGEI